MNHSKTSFLAKRLLSVLIGFILVGSLAFLALRQTHRAPSYHGKTVREWLRLLDPHVDHQAEHDQAAQAIAQIGAAALPELNRILRRRPNSWRERLRTQAVRFRLLKPEPMPVEEQQFRAARAAYMLAEGADVDIRPLIPQFAHQVTNSNYVDSEAGRALADAGPEGISVLTNLLATGIPRVRDRAAWALHLVRTKPGVVEALIRATSDPDRSVRVTTILSLSQRNGPTNLIVPVGLRFLRSEDAYERWGGATLLQGYTSAAGVSQALQAATEDPDEKVRSAAKRALQH